MTTTPKPKAVSNARLERAVRHRVNMRSAAGCARLRRLALARRGEQ